VVKALGLPASSVSDDSFLGISLANLEDLQVKDFSGFSVAGQSFVAFLAGYFRVAMTDEAFSSEAVMFDLVRLKFHCSKCSFYSFV
jgi:hypothetical protein